jgi:hypothetical protein
MHSRLRIFLALCLIILIGLGLYLYSVSTRQPTPPGSQVQETGPAQESASPTLATDATANVPAAQTIFFKHTGLDAKYGVLAQITTAAPDEIKFIDGLRCEAVHVSGGKGICLTADRGVLTTYAAVLFDADTFKVTASLPLNGVPSRCRVSIDGKVAALTIFVTGHGYAS